MGILEIKSVVCRLAQDPIFALAKIVLLVHQIHTNGKRLSSEFVLKFQQYKHGNLFHVISIRH